LSLRAFLLPCLVLASCAGGARDVVPESRDVVKAEPAAASGDGYVYVARRSLGVVALAEARGIGEETASRAVDRIADKMDACALDLARQGKLVDGAVRVVAPVGTDGAIGALNVKLAPGNGVAANAILCVIAPLKLLAFPPAEGDAGARGLAIEAEWGKAPRQ
jgi:hypothetical protein